MEVDLKREGHVVNTEHGIRFQREESNCSCSVSFCWLTLYFPKIGGLFWSSKLKRLHVIKFSETWNSIFVMWCKANVPWYTCTPVQRHNCGMGAFFPQTRRPSWWPWELKASVAVAPATLKDLYLCGWTARWRIAPTRLHLLFLGFWCNLRGKLQGKKILFMQCHRIPSCWAGPSASGNHLKLRCYKRCCPCPCPWLFRWFQCCFNT